MLSYLLLMFQRHRSSYLHRHDDVCRLVLEDADDVVVLREFGVLVVDIDYVDCDGYIFAIERAGTIGGYRCNGQLAQSFTVQRFGGDYFSR